MPSIRKHLPSRKSAVLAVLSAVLLILAFPDFEWSVLAWVALIPLLVAIDREKESGLRSLLTGWIWGVCFFTGSCWWLTFSPITYAGFPWPLAYFLLICVCSIVAVFPALFSLIAAVAIRRAGAFAILWTPFIWIATEFLRFWITGNNWNAIAYSQAFGDVLLKYAGFGGIYLVGFMLLVPQALAAAILVHWLNVSSRLKASGEYVSVLNTLIGRPFARFSKAYGDHFDKDGTFLGPLVSQRLALLYVVLLLTYLIIWPMFELAYLGPAARRVVRGPDGGTSASVIAIQPNVPMSGLSLPEYEALKRKHVTMAESAFGMTLEQRYQNNLDLQRSDNDREYWTEAGRRALTARFEGQPKIVIFPESPMNFLYEEDKDFQEFVRAFAIKNNASVLFNSAEPDPANKKYFNSAVMVNAKGEKVAQYDKIYLVPFGESVPSPLAGLVPAMVGSFSYGREYDLLPFGDAKGGIMICFESHFPNLSREYVREGADILVEMTNDGYLGPTPILRQHLGNAVFRAVETNRPVLRVTNVGITAYIDEKGVVHDPTRGYIDDVRIWGAGRSVGDRTFYVMWGDWFAWISSAISLWLLLVGIFRRKRLAAEAEQA